MSESLTGTCNCGAVQFAVTEPFVSATYCHYARVAASGFSLVRGSDRLRSWKPDSGAEKFFCGDCGSAMFSRSGPEWVGVRLGVLDGDPGIRPSAHQYVAYAAAWEPLPEDGLERHPESAASR